MNVLCIDNGAGTCPQCGGRVRRGFARQCPAGPLPPPPRPDPPKLGDRVEAVLKSLGIPTCGGCAGRRDALNRVSDWWRKKLS